MNAPLAWPFRLLLIPALRLTARLGGERAWWAWERLTIALAGLLGRWAWVRPLLAPRS